MSKSISTWKVLKSVFEKEKVEEKILSKISIWKGDITRLEIDCIVNAANNELAGGGGVDGAIHAAAGIKALQTECRKIGRCETGAAVITSPCQIKHIKNIIHTVGPKIPRGREPTESERDKLISCYDSSLRLATQNNLRTIAFCSISTGVFGYPAKLAAADVSKFIFQWLSHEADNAKIDRIVFTCFSDEDFNNYVSAFEKTVK